MIDTDAAGLTSVDESQKVLRQPERSLDSWKSSGEETLPVEMSTPAS